MAGVAGVCPDQEGCPRIPGGIGHEEGIYIFQQEKSVALQDDIFSVMSLSSYFGDKGYHHFVIQSQARSLTRTLRDFECEALRKRGRPSLFNGAIFGSRQPTAASLYGLGLGCCDDTMRQDKPTDKWLEW